MKVAFLLVTCCLERSRFNILEHVVENLKEQMPLVLPTITVIDNASTVPGTIELLRSTFNTVCHTNKNVGYWSAIWWWLDQMINDPPDYVYIIESDMIHYNFPKFWDCVTYLNEHLRVGSVRLQRYSYVERHRYNKNIRRPDSFLSDMQSHTNHATGKPVVFMGKNLSGILEPTFLTKLPALNRYSAMKEVFDELLALKAFSEHDFQRLYWKRYELTGLLDLGIYHCDLTGYGSNNITSSWTNPTTLQQIGYLPTRQASIMAPDLYTVTKLT